MALRVELHLTGVGTIPPRRLFRVEGTGSLTIEEWKRLAEIPGAFFLARGHTIPARGNFAEGEHLSNGYWPDPVFVPTAHAEFLETVLTKIDIGAELPGLDVLPSIELTATKPGYLRAPYHLYPFQERAVAQLLDAERMLLLLKGGSGKTAIATAAAVELHARGEIDRVVVISSRRAMRLVWAHFFKEYYWIDTTVVEGSPAQRAKTLASADPGKPVLTKYDSWRLPDFPKLIGPLLGPRTLVIIDEVHHLKNPLALRSKAIRKLLDNGPNGPTRFRLFLTGTIVYDKPHDAYGPIDLLGLNIWSTLKEFEELYFEIETIRTNRWDQFRHRPVEVSVASHLKGDAEAKALRQAIESVAFTADVDLELPPLRSEEVEIELSEAEERLYERIIETPIERAVEGGVQDYVRDLLPLMQIERLFSSDPSLVVNSDSFTAGKAVETAGGPDVLRAVSPGTKAKAFLEYVGNLLSEDATTKIVVFTPFEKTLEFFERLGTQLIKTAGDDEAEDIATALDTIRNGTVWYHGGLSDKEGDDRIHRFLLNPSVRLLFSTDAGSESQNYQAAASVVIHYDPPLELGAYDQRLWRVYRRGQGKSVLEVEFVLSRRRHLAERLLGTRFIDERIRDLLEWKRTQREAVVG